MPMTVISVSGRVRHIRPLPSDSTTSSVPVSATPKLAPEIATFARRNRLRRCARAAIASRRGSSVSSGSTSGISRRKISRISARLRWIAGTRMCDGMSCPSWTISSARSVSYAAMPAASSASLSPISWVAIDLTLTTSVSPVACTSRVTIALASLASRAQCTTPPRAVTSRSSRSRCSSSRAIVERLIASPASRSCSQSSSSPTTCARFVADHLRGVAEVAAQLGVLQARRARPSGTAWRRAGARPRAGRERRGKWVPSVHSSAGREPRRSRCRPCGSCRAPSGRGRRAAAAGDLLLAGCGDTRTGGRRPVRGRGVRARQDLGQVHGLRAAAQPATARRRCASGRSCRLR